MTPEKLIKHALTAQNRAAAPYSQYQVGSAILTEDNTVILGCNVESKAYPTTLCAERVAIFSAIAQGYRKFSAMALRILTNASEPPMPQNRLLRLPSNQRKRSI